MKVRVRTLRSQGRKVKQYGTAAQGVVGDLTMHTMAESGANSYTVATLRAGAPKDPDLLPPLYEPTMVTIGGTGLLLRGFESIDGASCVQEWHCELE
jgi:hypothetical protein